MAVSYINVATGGATAASSSTLSPLSVTAGNGLLVFVQANYTALPTLSVADDAAWGTNTYTLVDGPHDNDSVAVVGAIYACASAKATANLTFTVTASTGTPGLRIVVCQVSGQDVSTMCDVANTASYSSDASPLGAEITPTRAGIAFGYFGNSSSFSFIAWDGDWTTVFLGSRSGLARQTSVAGTIYTPGLTFSGTESGLLMAANVQEAVPPGVDDLTAYAMEIQN